MTPLAAAVLPWAISLAGVALFEVGAYMYHHRRRKPVPRIQVVELEMEAEDDDDLRRYVLERYGDRVVRMDIYDELHEQWRPLLRRPSPMVPLKEFDKAARRAIRDAERGA